MGENSEIKRKSDRRNPVGLLSFMNINGKESRHYKKIVIMLLIKTK